MGYAFFSLAVAISWTVHGQELTEKKFLEDSLQFRTALHHDSLLETPLDALVKLYRSAGREDELIGVYRSHIEQYPDDAGAKTVLIRLLRRVNRGGADELIASAVPLHPDFAPLQYVFFKYLQERGDARAPEALSRAIDLETNPARRNDWLDQLLLLSEGGSVRDLAKAQFGKILADDAGSAGEWMDLAGLMQRYQFWEQSITAINRAKALKPGPEAEIEADMMLSIANARLGNSDEAGKLLEALIKKLAPNHWRRREVMSLRLNILASEEQRKEFLEGLASAYRKSPGSEAVILDYAEALIASERPGEAVKILVDALVVLPSSQILESRVLELFEVHPDHLTYSRYLENRLELFPDRIDLRFRLVKTNYALGKDSAAEQDFKVVVAGLPPGEVSDRILELQRYLRSIERVEAAATYLERYVRNHPTRLDVARELAEVYLAVNSRDGVEGMVKLINAEEADSANVLDLTRFLVQEEFFNAARHTVTSKLAVEPRQFELNLALVEILATMGEASAANQQISMVREMTDTVERYGQWLETSVAAHRKLESLPRFFETEQNRFSFADGQWSEDKVEKFLILCEVGKKQLFTDRVAGGIREQLGQPGIDGKLRLRLRAFLVGVLENVPSAAAEVEEQLKVLATEDPANRFEYDLRRALVYHRSQRVDLAQNILGGIDLTQIDSTPLLREASDILVEYGFLKEAEVAVGVVNRIDPGDLLSWERRLILLVALRDETNFRAVIRSLRNGEAGVRLRESSNRSLAEHLNASYWRSISTFMSLGETELENVLPLLGSLEREELLPETRLWADWTRALVLTRLGREAEASEAIKRFQERALLRKVETVSFPDGLVLTVNSASDFLTPRPARGEDAGLSFGFLLNEPVMKWAYELPSEASLVRALRSDDRIVVLDDRSSVHVLDAASGKLLWRKPYGPDENGDTSVSDALRGIPQSGQFSPRWAGGVMTARTPQSFAVAGGRFFLVLEGELRAFSVLDGSNLWKAKLPIPETAQSDHPATGASPGIAFALEGENTVVFDPASGNLCCINAESGKLLWNLAINNERLKGEGKVFSLNSGLTVSGGHAFAYGADSVIVDIKSGKVVWRFSGEESPDFPVVIREEREEGSGTAEKAADPDLPKAFLPTPVNLTRESSESGIFDFRSKPKGGPPGRIELLSGTFNLLGPAVYWSKSRSQSREPGYAVISEGYLLLMQEGKVSRISIRLPVAGTELPAGGTYLGQAGNHAWFLDGESLLHLDFQSRSHSRVTVKDLGDPRTVRATVVGNQLLVRGLRSMKVINAITGQVVGQVSLPPSLVEYLSQSGISESIEKGADPLWQGVIQRKGDGAPPYVFNADELISEHQFITSFGGQILVCLESTKRETATSSSNPSPPPAP